MKFGTALIVAAFMAASGSITLSQTADQREPGGPRTPGGPEGGRRPPPPIIAALDLNHDGVISADEIAKAPGIAEETRQERRWTIDSGRVAPAPSARRTTSK